MNGDTKPTSGLFLIGGAADTIHETLLDLAGGPRAKIVLLPHASGVPEEVADSVSDSLFQYGFKNVEIIGVEDDSFDIPNDTTCVYALGGDQSRLVKRLGSEGFEKLIKFIEAGGLYAGTSAGSACVGERMITGGMSDGILKKGSLDIDRGLALLSGLIVDQHFRNRNRFNRLMYATASESPITGIGIDEDTAALISSDGNLKVFGQGQVSIFETGDGTKITGDDTNQNVTGLSISCLSAGSSFKLENVLFAKGSQ